MLADVGRGEVRVTVVAEANPTVARRKLSVHFRKLREQHGTSYDELATILGVDRSQASRLYTGARGFRVADVLKLSRLYGLSEAEQAALVALAEEARKRAWWQQYDLAPSLRTLIGMEQAALSINEFASSVVPGLLQTPAYAEHAASVAYGAVDVPRQRVADAVKVRMRRQEILNRPDSPELWVVIDEAVLARVGGGPAVMRQQLEHLYQKTNDPRVTIQVVTFEHGLYPSSGHVILLEMAGELPDVLYQEALAEPDDTSDWASLQAARRLWDHLRALAASPRGSAELILQYIDRLPT